MFSDLLQFAIYVAILTALAWPLGLYMVRVFKGERTFLSPVLAPVERAFYGIARVRPDQEQHWTRYAYAVLAFHFAGWLLLYAILRLQDVLPWNPQELPALSEHLAFNTAVSFMTNTNWQSYGGETTMSYFSQMIGLTTQNFVSAASGIAIGVAVIRGFAGRQIKTIGNFWVDLTRSTLYILLPLAIIAALVLVWQGVPQNMDAYVGVTTLEGAEQTIAQGPAASQIAIKQLGTNGGGFFNANSSVPYENPTPLSNLIECVFILLIGAAFCFMFGRMVLNMRQGLAIFGAMMLLFLGSLALTYVAEMQGNALLDPLPVDQSAGYLEGKEVRFGTGLSALWATATTAASNGSVNAMHDSFTPLGAVAPLLQMQIGEVIFGGVGSGFYGMLVFVILTIFLAGLMVGRTPEYLGKKIEAKEVALAIITFLVMPLGVLGFSALAAVLPEGLSSLQDKGPHGLTEILYAYSSATGNNGSAFAGLNANTPWYDTTLGICMLLGRFAFIVPLLAIAGSLGAKKTVPPSAGTFPTHTPLFAGLLAIVVLIIGALTFFPALALGPFAEHFEMLGGHTF
jgi:K+-transporting ATPase ATPase A chain